MMRPSGPVNSDKITYVDVRMEIKQSLPPLSREDALEVDIDLRIAQIWQELPADMSELSFDTVAALMRACYGKGYTDALSEDTPGELCVSHGYKVPARASA